MKKALLYIISSIVSEGDKIEIEEKEQDGIIDFMIKVPKVDMGKVIGKNGKVIRSIRNVMKIKAIKENKRINITLEEGAS